MALEIVRHTPLWVWIALAVLLRRGYAMSQPHRIAIARTTLLPGVMLLLSLAGVVSAFGTRPEPLLCWGAGLALAAYEAQRRGPIPGVRYLAEERCFAMPGSWMPMALFLLIFAVKYGVGVATALHGPMGHSGGLGLGVALIYGAISGLFLGRALRLWLVRRLAPPWQPKPALS